MKFTEVESAFPSQYEVAQHDSRLPEKLLKSRKGMSLRDWFAGMALQGMLAGMESNPDCMKAAMNDSVNRGMDIYEHLSWRAFLAADAMLKAREANEVIPEPEKDEE